MSKRPDTLETVLLVIELLRRIPRSRKITAQELQLQLKEAGMERDVRTIQRQLKTLCEHFNDIEYDDRVRPYGYQWREQSKALAIASLTPQESLLLLLAQEHLRNLLPVHLMKSMEGFFVQARRNLGPNSTAKLEREWPGKIRVVATSQPLLPPPIKANVFEAVSEALYSNRLLLVDYRNAAGKTSEVEVMPLGLAQQGPRLYLVARFTGYENERSLALHRIQKAEVLPYQFVRPKDFDLKRYEDDGRFGFGEGQRVRLEFCIAREAGKHLLESPLSRDQEVKEIEGGYEITATVVDSSMLEWWLRGFGTTVWNVRRAP